MGTGNRSFNVYVLRLTSTIDVDVERNSSTSDANLDTVAVRESPEKRVRDVSCLSYVGQSALTGC